MSSEHNHHHIVPPSTYVAILAALGVLTWATVAVAKFDLGALNNVVMLGIATLKATLVVLFFMHAKYSTSLIKATMITAICFLLLLLAYLFADVVSRDWLVGAGRELPPI